MGLSDEHDLLIASYALGVLERDQRAEVEEILALLPEARERLLQWQERFAALEPKSAPLSPSETVWAGITQQLGFVTAGIRSSFAVDGAWVPIKPGIDIKFLEVDPATATRTALLRMEQGAVLDPHHHAKTERCLIVEGEVIIGDDSFRKADYHIAPIDTVHRSVTAITPAVILLHWS